MSDQPEFNLGPLTPEEAAVYGEPDGKGLGTKIIGGTTGPMFQEPEMQEWRRVTLSKWKHYRDVVLPSGNPVAIAVHEHGLLKCIPFLIGHPELEITIEDEERIHSALSERSRLKGFRQESLGRPSMTVDGVEIPKVRLGESWGNDDPHRHEEDAMPYPREGLDFGPDCG